MERLSEAVVRCNDYVDAEVQFEKDAQGLTVFHGHLATQVTLICQRCNGELDYPVEAEFCFTPVQGEEQESDDIIPEAYEPVEVNDHVEVNLLQIFEDGRLTDSKGRTIDFKNTLLIMTSNVGSKVIEKGGGGLGFELSEDQTGSHYNRIKSLVNEELKQYFRPEFLNRLDEIIVFRQLTKNEVKEIAEIMLQEVFIRLQDKGIKLNVTDAFKERLVEEGYNPSYGARPLRRAVMRLLEDSLAEEVLSGRIKDGDSALVDIDDNKKVTINISSEESSQELAGANF